MTSTTKALVVTTGGGIGDALFATIAARALRTRYETVDALTTAAHRIIFERSGEVREAYPDAHTASVAARLGAEHYSAAVVTWATSRSAILPLLARIPVRVGQARRLYSRAFTHRVVVRSELGDRTTHWTQILLDFTRAIGCEIDDAVPHWRIEARDRIAAAHLRSGETGDAPYVLLHPTRGISHLRQGWPLEGFVALAHRLRERYGVHVLVTGSEGDRALADAIAAGAGAHSIAGRTTLPVFAALAADAHAVVAMDSGPMHIAAATGVPTVGIFALQSDEPQRWAPLGPRVAVVRGTYPCPPWHRKETCPGFPCVRALPAEAVLHSLDGLLARFPERVPS